MSLVTMILAAADQGTEGEDQRGQELFSLPPNEDNLKPPLKLVQSLVERSDTHSSFHHSDFDCIR